ncbi:MAG TPA: AraC family transcriptional regulator [Candidatus Corynebacterium avicola]|uniref:AraC family transcriptional regulator n=1 Tax=Candidatus Corynebacterium avicola TaxID=2838527 RepID=A0A9D1RQD5_9CORY|nr:AraC family transcriptional regulator [Candidatus Corynebacterium avicola]
MTTSPPDISHLLHIPATNIPERVHHDLHLLLWQVRGVSDFMLRPPGSMSSHDIQLSAGHVLWLPVGYRHKVHVHANSTMLPTFFDAASTATSLNGPTIIPVDDILQSLILAQIQMNHTVIRPEANIARQILSLIEDAPKANDSLPTPTSEPARRIAEAIRFNPGDDRSASELAESVHTSLRSVQRHFTAETGMNLQQWRTRVRVIAGAGLLRNGSTLTAVAGRTGYADVSSFCRAFKSHYGVPTGEYLKRYAQR